MRPGDPKYRYLYTVWATLECLGFGGLIYGWGSLLFVLKDEGIYSDLCDNDNNGTISDPSNSTSENDCDARDTRLALVFTIGSAMFSLFGFLLGQINFKFGTRVTRLTAAFFLISGSIMIAFTSKDIPWLLFPGLSLIGGGGIAYLMTNTQISLLFTTGGSFVVGLICGSFDTSSGVMLMVKFGYEGGISRLNSFIIIAATHVLTLISTFFFLPKDFITKTPALTKEINKQRTPDESGTIYNEQAMYGASADGEAKKPTDIPSLKSCMLSPTYILNVAWMSILQLRFYFALASLNTMMNDRLPTKDDVSFYTNVQMYVLMGGIITSPLAGIVFDVQIKLFKDSRSQLRRSLMPTVLPTTLTSLFCIAMSASILIEEPQFFYAVFIFMLIFRSFMYTMAAGVLSNIFPSEYFGLMYGVQLVISGVFSLLQYALYKWAEATSFEQVNLFLLALVCVSFVHPIYHWIVSKRAERAETK